MKLKRFLCMLLCIVFVIPYVNVSARAMSAKEHILEEVNKVYNDPDATMTDIIRVTNPEAYAVMTDEQRSDFEKFRYQDIKNGTVAEPAIIQIWGYDMYADAYCPQKGTIKFGCVFFCEITPGPLSSDCPFVGLTCAVIDKDNGNRRIAFESESDHDTSYLSLEGTVSEGVVAGHHYDNECEVYGYTPLGDPFVYYRTKSLTAK